MKAMNVVNRRKIWYAISLLVIIPGLLCLLFRGFYLGIDFTGGNIFQIQFSEQVNAEQIREVVGRHVLQTPSVQSSEDSFIIRTATLSEESSTTLLADLKTTLGEHSVLRNESIGGVIGKELTRNAIISLILAFVLMFGYIAFRFKFNYAVAAITALIHDVLVVVSVVSILQIELSSSFIAAVLTIVGYSINNTIVIFDRIRENASGYKKDSFGTLIDTSIRQTLARSINTNVAVMLLLLCLFFFGGSTTKDFVLILIIGVAAGAYSSIFLAGSLLYEITNIRENISANKKKQLAAQTKPAKAK